MVGIEIINRSSHKPDIGEIQWKRLRKSKQKQKKRIDFPLRFCYPSIAVPVERVLLWETVLLKR